MPRGRACPRARNATAPPFRRARARDRARPPRSAIRRDPRCARAPRTRSHSPTERVAVPRAVAAPPRTPRDAPHRAGVSAVSHRMRRVRWPPARTVLEMSRNTACAGRASAYDARMKTRTITILVFTVLLLAACGRQERVREIDWAKSALARNPAYEIVATDESAGVFTVKDTVSGTVSTIRLEELIATPAPARGAKPQAAGQSAPAVSPDAATATQLASGTAEPASETSQTTETEPVAATPAASGTPLVEGPGYSIS